MVALHPAYAAACAWAFASGFLLARLVWPDAFRGPRARRFLWSLGAGVTLAALVDF